MTRFERIMFRLGWQRVGTAPVPVAPTPVPVAPAVTRPRQSATIPGLLVLARTYAAHQGLSLSTVSTYVTKDGKIFGRLERGEATCTLRRADQILQWFSDNWPVDLEWPAGIERPAPSAGAARQGAA